MKLEIDRNDSSSIELKKDNKCINKEERVRHLPGYCPQTSQENKDAEER